MPLPFKLHAARKKFNGQQHQQHQQQQQQIFSGTKFVYYHRLM